MGRHLSTRKLAARGFTLVELMVALILGLLILGGVITVYVNNTSAARFQTGVLRAQENGRFAIELMSRSIRMAGYDMNNAVGANFISGTTGSSGTTFTETGLESGADTISITYEGGTEIRDCQGNTMTSSDVVSNQYAIFTDSDGVSHLICSTANGNGLALAEGVEDLVLLYGIDSDGDGVPERYVNADNVGTWSQVTSVQVALLVNSVVPALSQDETVCLGCTVFAGSEDRMVRAEFLATIEVRNNLAD